VLKKILKVLYFMQNIFKILKIIFFEIRSFYIFLRLVPLIVFFIAMGTSLLFAFSITAILSFITGEFSLIVFRGLHGAIYFWLFIYAYMKNIDFINYFSHYRIVQFSQKLSDFDIQVISPYIARNTSFYWNNVYTEFNILFSIKFELVFYFLLIIIIVYIRWYLLVPSYINISLVVIISILLLVYLFITIGFYTHQFKILVVGLYTGKLSFRNSRISKDRILAICIRGGSIALQCTRRVPVVIMSGLMLDWASYVLFDYSPGRAIGNRIRQTVLGNYIPAPNMSQGEFLPDIPSNVLPNKPPSISDGK
jgi:hypothetical protein